MTNMKTNSTFKLTVINIGTSTGLVTVAVGTGITAVGNLVVAITGSAAGVVGRRSSCSAKPALRRTRFTV
jgi:hypothetical protein